MEFFIQKLFNGKGDKIAHLQFEKYSRGNFTNKAIVQCKASAKGYSIATTSEYANEFVRFLGNELGGKTTNVEGVIISTKELPSHIKYSNISQFMGVKKYVIGGEMSGNDIVSICDSVPRAFIALSFSTPTSELKVKQKAPKSAKPGNSDDGPKVDFCKLKTTNKSIVHSLLFDVGDFKQAEANHTFMIENIIVPKNEKDPIKMREDAVRQGKILRILKVDGKEQKKEFVFSA